MKTSYRPTAKILILIMALFCSLLSPVVYASDEEVDESQYLPRVKLSSAPNITTKSGESKEHSVTVRNVGTARAHNLFIQVVPNEDTPFNVYFTDIGNSSVFLQNGSERTCKLMIASDKSTLPGTYAVTLKYTYTNQFRREFSETDQLFIRIDNPDAVPKIELFDFTMEPTSLKAGATSVITAKYENRGNLPAKDVRIGISGLDKDTINIQNGLTSQSFSQIGTSAISTLSFQISAASSLKNGNYPITFYVEYKDDNGTSYKDEQIYFVNVGGTASTGLADISVVNMSAPTSAFGVGQNFSISLNIRNTSGTDAENLKITANTGDGNEIIPTSASVQNTRVLKAGATETFTFRFAPTSDAKSRNYPIAFLIEYEDGSTAADGTNQVVSFSQYAGINVLNPDADDDDDDEKDKNIPIIIISNYSTVPVVDDDDTGANTNVPKAGKEFDLKMTFMNTHSLKPVKNIKVSLTVTDKDDKVGASIFSPVNASNTIYIDYIGTGQTVSREIRYYTIPDAQPQNYSIDVNFEYEDAEGNRHTGKEIVGVNVAQPPQIEITQIDPPGFASVGEPVFIDFQMYNTGKVSLNNLIVTIDGNFDLQPGYSKSNWYGELESQSMEDYSISIFPTEVGLLDGTITISYDSPSGDHVDDVYEFSMDVSEPMFIDFEGDDMGMYPDMNEGGFFSRLMQNKLVLAIIIIVVVAAVGAGAFFGFKFYKKKKQDNFDDFDDLDSND